MRVCIYKQIYMCTYVCTVYIFFFIFIYIQIYRYIYAHIYVCLYRMYTYRWNIYVKLHSYSVLSTNWRRLIGWLYVSLSQLLYSMLMHMNSAPYPPPCPLPVHHSAPHMPLPRAPLIQPLGAWLSLTCHQITHTKFTCIPRLSSCCRFVTKNKSWSSWLSRSGASAASLIGRDRSRGGRRFWGGMAGRQANKAKKKKSIALGFMEQPTAEIANQ